MIANSPLLSRQGMCNVAHFIGSLHVGGAENQVMLLANALDNAKYHRHIIVMNDNDAGFKDDLAADIAYYSIRYRKRYTLAASRRLHRYLVDNKIDILHCHMYHAIVFGSAVGKMASVPVIVTSEHGKNSWKKWWNHAVEKYLVNHLVDRRIAVSDDIRTIRINEDGVEPGKIIVMPNCVDTRVEICDASAEPKVIGSLGRLVDAKDFEVLIKAVRLLIDRGYRIKLLIAGEGGKRAELEKLVTELSMGNVVRLPGIMKAEDFFSSIDVFAMSSKLEGVPVALLEAMAHGFGIVATSVGGIPEVVEDGVHGLLCRPGDPDLLSRRLAEIIDDSTLRNNLANNAREKVVESYGTDSVAAMWSDLYLTLFAEKRKQ